MLKRLGLGLLKGLVIGGAIGAGLHFGLAWTAFPAGLLGFLVAMGAAGTTGVFAGKLPWQEGAWIEGVLKGAVGVGVGALAYWGLTYLPLEIPFPGVEGTASLASLPLVFAPTVAGVYGALVELDNSGSAGDSAAPGGPKARVETDSLDLDLLEEEAPAGGRAKKRGRA